MHWNNSDWQSESLSVYNYDKPMVDLASRKIHLLLLGATQNPPFCSSSGIRIEFTNSKSPRTSGERDERFGLLCVPRSPCSDRGSPPRASSQGKSTAEKRKQGSDQQSKEEVRRRREFVGGGWRNRAPSMAAHARRLVAGRSWAASPACAAPSGRWSRRSRRRSPGASAPPRTRGSPWRRRRRRRRRLPCSRASCSAARPRRHPARPSDTAGSTASAELPAPPPPPQERRLLWAAIGRRYAWAPRRLQQQQRRLRRWVRSRPRRRRQGPCRKPWACGTPRRRGGRSFRTTQGPSASAPPPPAPPTLLRQPGSPSPPARTPLARKPHAQTKRGD